MLGESGGVEEGLEDDRVTSLELDNDVSDREEDNGEVSGEVGGDVDNLGGDSPGLRVDGNE